MDVVLLSVVPLLILQSLDVIYNCTIACNNAGGMHFENCHNSTIIYTTWEKSGTKNGSKPVIKIHNSFVIIIQICTFQHSVTQVLVFSKVSGNVTIDVCN